MQKTKNMIIHEDDGYGSLVISRLFIKTAEIIIKLMIHHLTAEDTKINSICMVISVCLSVGLASRTAKHIRYRVVVFPLPRTSA